MESISSSGVVELRIHVSVCAMMSSLWLSVRSLRAVGCSRMSMLKDEHGAGNEGADEEV